jgi:hypothetical protein
MTDELNVKANRVTGFQTSRGFAGRQGTQELLNDIVGLTLRLEDYDKPTYFIMAPEEAEQIGQALIDSARRTRDE